MRDEFEGVLRGGSVSGLFYIFRVIFFGYSVVGRLDLSALSFPVLFLSSRLDYRTSAAEAGPVGSCVMLFVGGRLITYPLTGATVAFDCVSVGFLGWNHYNGIASQLASFDRECLRGLPEAGLIVTNIESSCRSVLAARKQACAQSGYRP